MSNPFALINQQKTIGKLIIENPDFTSLIDKEAKIEVLAEGFIWSEGPVWNKEGEYLLFSDIPKNTIYKWKESEELSVFLSPSGYTGIHPYSEEPGSNGLIINNKKELVACEHGDRRITKMPINGGGGKFTLADTWNGKRFNSPNDIVQASNGTYYFTDPPYGLPDGEYDSTREIDLYGVYKIAPDGTVSIVIKDLTRPNGVALSPDENILYVTQSDPDAAYIMAYPILPNGDLVEGKILFDATPMVKAGLPGFPDGIKTDINGNIFSAAPGGIVVLTPQGKLLGKIATEVAAANLNWGNNGEVLYITAHMYLARIITKTIGKGF